jgi:hypothetical protein
MKTFNEFISEDFNSNGATQITVPLKSKGSPTVDQPVFYEKLPVKPFNLVRYMQSFTDDARNILKNTPDFVKYGWRGVVVYDNKALLVFVWPSKYLHHDIMGAIQNNPGVAPKIKYLQIYNSILLLDPGEKIKDSWCFPFVWDGRKLDVNLEDDIMDSLNDQKGINKLFMI